MKNPEDFETPQFCATLVETGAEIGELHCGSVPVCLFVPESDCNSPALAASTARGALVLFLKS
jgi:hypothetical protein